jgi:hypothetical protein
MRVRIEGGPGPALDLLAAEASAIETSPLLMQLKAQLQAAHDQAEP